LEWKCILEAHVPFYLQLSDEDRNELEGHIEVFMAEKIFEGCAGLEVTEEMKVSIAAQACLLLLHRKTDYYPGLQSILVYPSTFEVPTNRYVGSGIVEERRRVLAGEA